MPKLSTLISLDEQAALAAANAPSASNAYATALDLASIEGGGLQLSPGGVISTNSEVPGGYRYEVDAGESGVTVAITSNLDFAVKTLTVGEESSVSIDPNGADIEHADGEINSSPFIITTSNTYEEFYWNSDDSVWRRKANATYMGGDITGPASSAQVIAITDASETSYPFGTLADGEYLTVSGGQIESASIPGGGGTVVAATNGFRMSPSGIPDGGSGSLPSASTQITLAPYSGDLIALYDGANWGYIQSGGANYTLSGRTADLPFDIFAHNSAGLALEALDWASMTARATTITSLNGVWVKDGDPTRRYIGTCRPASATTYLVRTYGYTAGSSSPTNEGPARFDLWNVDNRIVSSWSFYHTAANWIYTTAAIREVAGESNTGFQGVYGPAGGNASGTMEVYPKLTANLCVGSANTSGSPVNRVAGLGVSFNLTAPTSFSPYGVAAAVASGNDIKLQHYSSLPVVFSGSSGILWVAWLEWSQASGTTTWYGSDVATGTFCGMTGTWEW